MRPGEPGYDPRTLYIPRKAWAEFTPFEKQVGRFKGAMIHVSDHTFSTVLGGKILKCSRKNVLILMPVRSSKIILIRCVLRSFSFFSLFGATELFFKILFFQKGYSRVFPSP